MASIAFLPQISDGSKKSRGNQFRVKLLLKDRKISSRCEADHSLESAILILALKI